MNERPISKGKSDSASLDRQYMIEVVKEIVRQGPVCDACLGRQFAKISTGLTNEDRGRFIRRISGLKSCDDTCWVCNGLFDQIEEWAEMAVKRLRDYEYDSFLVGTKIDGMRAENEEMLWEISGTIWAESMKSELNREVGKIIQKETNKSVDFVRPDILVLLNLDTESIELQINSLFVYGRYRKLMRGIPQTRWPCRECDGTGCECCGFTGKIYEKSVEELICRSVLDEFGGEDLILHGCGREDVDALMLGPGRPFVFEVKEPVKRRISISSLQRRINKENEKEIAVFCLRYVKKEVVARIKNLKFDKVYRAKLEIEGNISKSELEMALEGLTGAIHQRTPFRVSQRRKDIVRDRRVRCAKIVSFDERLIEVCCESGLYIKELISGDEGRTIPNLSDLLKKDTRVSELDVINMKYPLTH